MRTSQQLVDNPELQKEFQIRRFLWLFTAGWYMAKKTNKLDRAFWDKQRDQLVDFDQGFPGHHRVAGMAPAVKAPALALAPGLPTTTTSVATGSDGSCWAVPTSSSSIIKQ